MNSKEKIKQILGILVDLQVSDGKPLSGCAPIEVSIGTVIDGIVRNGYVIIKDAPPCVAESLTNEGFHLSIGRDGVSVY